MRQTAGSYLNFYVQYRVSVAAPNAYLALLL